jgi:Fur family zinc uptake transcriptional regulator
MTPWRGRVLELLKQAGKALGAYDLLDQIAREDGKAPAPISVYRALDGLMEAGLIHRLASKNAYMACERRHCVAESVAFLICERCGRVEEAASGALRVDLGALAQAQGFKAQTETIEILGICAQCRAAA